VTAEHSRTLGPKIAADYRLLNHLRGRSTSTVDDIEPDATRIEVDGGAIASSCHDDHDEVLTCWAYYRESRRPD
jgi:hypothetical protein